MANWMIYLRERFPLSTYLILSLGFALSGAFLSVGNWSWGAVSISTFGLMLFFAELRLMDEYKDYSKDLVAHPERPLPRGILQLDQVQSAIVRVFLFMIVFSIAVGILFSPSGGALFFGFTLYLWLMYKEFYLGKWLSQFPLLYAITHQIILIPICLFVVAVQSPTFVLDQSSFAYAITVLGAFFGYEVCRKLDPRANPILKTYLSVYGPIKTSVLVVALLAIAAYGAQGFDAQVILWPIEILTALSLVVILFQPGRFKVVEGFATLSLACHIWSVPLQLALRKFV